MASAELGMVVELLRSMSLMVAWKSFLAAKLTSS